MGLFRAMGRLVAGLVPSALAGAFFLLSFVKIFQPDARPGQLLVVGAICGVVVVGLVRLFRVAPWGYPAAGFVCGPVPIFLVMQRGQDEPAAPDDRLAIWLFSALFGLLVGFLEWARVRRSAAEARD